MVSDERTVLLRHWTAMTTHRTIGSTTQHRVPQRLRRVLGTCLLIVVALLAGCTGEAPDTATDDVAEGERRPNGNVATRLNPRRYVAEWLVDAEAIGREAGGLPFNYVEIVDDRDGVYLVQGPEHLAKQTRAEVVFCAGIFAVSPSCAATARPRGVPDVLAIGLRAITEWSPTKLYQLSTPTEFEQAIAEDPTNWTSRRATHGTTPVVCYAAAAGSRAAQEGFEVCFTDDENELVASVDLQGDFLLDISLERYGSEITEFDLELPATVRRDADVYDQLVYIFPAVPDIVDIDPNAVEEVDAIGQVTGG